MVKKSKAAATGDIENEAANSGGTGGSFSAF